MPVVRLLPPVRPAALGLGVLLVLAGAAPGQATPAQATKQAKSGAKAALAGFKQRANDAFDLLDASLDAFVAGCVAGQFGTPLLQAFLDSTHAFQLEADDAREDAELAIAEAYSDAVAGLADSQGAPLDGFPTGFASGDQGSFDASVRSLQRAAERLHARVDKRAAKAIAAARNAGIGLTLQLFAPARRGFHGPSEGGSVGTFDNRVRVHLVAGASRLDTVHDGVVLVAGTGAFVVGDVTVQLVGAAHGGGPLIVSQAATPASSPGLGGEWSLILDDGGDGLVETNYNLDAFFAGDLTSADACVGVP